MAMLAEPRQRKRYNLVPRGKALYEDDTNFGTKMLEKMGWTKGNGLGANEDGNKDFVRVRYKNDAMGLGYEERDDQWTQHEQEFSGLLEVLNNEGSSNSGDANVKLRAESSDEVVMTAGFGYSAATSTSSSAKQNHKLKEKISGESLEEKSKRSKARVHYKKFTRGKDLTRYSEKDLANIFGRKATKEEQVTDIYQHFANVSVQQEEIPKKKSDEEGEVLQSGGTKIISTGVSVGDYFKQKMEAMRNKRLKYLNSVDMHDEETLPLTIQPNTENVNAGKRRLRDVECAESEAPSRKKKKKSKETQSDQDQQPATSTEEPTKLLKNKKIKIEKIEQTGVATEGIMTEVPIKKKTNKRISLEVGEERAKVAESDPLFVEPETKLSKKTKRDIAVEQKKRKSSMKSENREEKVGIETKTAVIEALEPSDDDSTEEMIKATGTKAAALANLSTLSLDELIVKSNSYNVYMISTFVAEKFRHTNLDAFVGANIANLTGYSFNEDLKLELKAIKNDEKRILKLWSGALSKYENQSPRNKFNRYARQVAKARSVRMKKLPRFNVKSWKRKTAFQGL